MISPRSRLSWLAALGLALPPVGAQTFTAKDRQPTPEELTQLPAVTASKVEGLMKDVSAPSEFQVTIFATPPAVNYPVFVAAATDGTLYVSSDGNGSLDRKPHLGRVLRVRDTNGDGVIDEAELAAAPAALRKLERLLSLDVEQRPRPVTGAASSPTLCPSSTDERGVARVTWVCVSMLLIGVRNSWAKSEANSDKRRKSSCRRSSI